MNGRSDRTAPALRRVGEACFWLLVIGATLLALVHVAARLRLVVLPVLLAIVLTTFLAPPVDALARRGWARSVATLAVVGLSLAAVGGVLAFIAPAVVDEFGRLDVELSESVGAVEHWLRDSPLPVSGDDLGQAVAQIEAQAGESVDVIAGSALSGALVLLEVVTGIALAIVITFFLLKDGRRITAWGLTLLPVRWRGDVEAAGARAWDALGGFVRGQTIVALVDAVLIGLTLVVVGVPLALPLAILTFFGAYVPVVGALVTGLLAVLMALVSQGVVAAVVVLVAIIGIQQLEGNVLQPVVVGRATHVHPVAILLGVTAGGVLAGIIGAMVSAPLVAAGGAMLAYVRERAEAGG